MNIRKYHGIIEAEIDILFGHVLILETNIISYERNNIKELKQDFQDGIDDYLENCVLEQDRNS